MNDSPHDDQSTGGVAGRLAAFVTDRPRWVVGIALLIAIVAVGISAVGLGFQSDRNALISEDLPFNANFRSWLERFPAMSDFVIVVDAGEDRGAAEQFVADLGPELEAMGSVESVSWGVDLSALGWDALALVPTDRLDEALDGATVLKLLSAQDRPADAFAALSDSFSLADLASTGEQRERAAQGVRMVRNLVDAMSRAALADEQSFDPTDSRLAEALSSPIDFFRYTDSANGRMLLMRVRPALAAAQLNAPKAAVADIRAKLAEVRERHPGVEAGLTGIDAIEADETDAAISDSTVASVVALFAISVLLIASFGSWRIPMCAAGGLLIAIAWSFGALTLAIGHLQVLSVVFVVVLLGLGVDFAIHIAAGLERSKERGITEPVPALARVFRLTGPGIVIGALTTAAAFAVTATTDFTGVAEMGLIAAIGIVLCVVSMFTVFPALLKMTSASEKRLTQRAAVVFDEHWLRGVVRRPALTAVIGLALTLGGGWLAFEKLGFSYDLMALQPGRTESVLWQARLAEEGGTSVWYAVSIAEGPDEARERVEQLRALPGVKRVGGAAMLFPVDQSTRAQMISEWAEQPVRTVRAEQTLAAQFARLAAVLPRTDAATPGDELTAELTLLRASAERARLALLEQGPPGLARVRDGFEAGARRTREAIAQLAAGEPIDPSRFASSVLGAFIADDGGLAITASPMLESSDQSPLAPGTLREFAAEIDSVDPSATGVLLQVFRSGELIRASFLRAGIYALAVVAIALVVSFRGLIRPALALVPVLTGFATTFGLMALFGKPVDLANVIVLPLMFGIGVDVGVHVIHRATQHPGELPLGLTHGTGKAIVLASVTTAIGFASMLLASHRGIAGLGLVVCVGISLTLLAALTVLPALLQLINGVRAPASDGSNQTRSAGTTDSANHGQ